MIPRLYCPGELAVGTTIELPADAAHHARDVLRLNVGDTATLLNGLGGEYTARLTAVTKREVRAELLAFEARDSEPPFPITVAQSLASGDKMDWVVEKAAELGAATIQPLAAARSVLRLTADRALRRQAHWEAIARSASAQCGRNRIAAIGAITPIDPWLFAQREAHGVKLMLSPVDAEAFSALPTPAPGTPITLLIGPEAGLTDGEEALARASGFLAVKLGPRVMRTETAALAALAAIHARWGDF